MVSCHPVYHTPDEGIYALQLAVKAYDKLDKKVVALKNQIKAKLRAWGVICSDSRVWGVRGRSEALAAVPNPAVREIIASDFQLLDALLEHKHRARRRFLSMASDIPVVRAWQAIPGVGPYVAAVFFPYVKCPRHFSDVRKLWRYSRLGITQCASGGRELKRKHLDRMGNPNLKRISRIAFQGAMRSAADNRFNRAYRHTLENTASEVHARLTVQRKILEVMWAMWLHGTPYDDDNRPSRWA